MTLIPTPHGTPVQPYRGRICQRLLDKGNAWVGVLHFPPDFTPEEGLPYLLIHQQGRLEVVPQAIGPSNLQYESSDVPGFLTQNIWNKTTNNIGRVVRFMEAFPQSNGWVVYGPSQHEVPEGTPAHQWWDVGPGGAMSGLAEPFEARGMGMGQILSQNAAWPNAEGELFSLPTLHAPWRQHYYAYHQLLALSTRDPKVDADLERIVAQHPHFRELSIGSIDRQFCGYLAQLEKAGLLGIDEPRTVDQMRSRDEATGMLVKSLLEDEKEHRKSSPRPR